MHKKDDAKKGMSAFYSFIKRHVSILGFKIALSVGFFMFIPTAVFLYFHIYREKGAGEVYNLLTTPSCGAQQDCHPAPEKIRYAHHRA